MYNSTIIAVFCYKRAAKLKVSVEALLKNPECASMEIIFFCDGYKNGYDKAGVLETREYVNSISGFKKVHKQFREKNLNSGPNFIIALEYLCNNYKQFIVLEDDIIATPNYLKYMIDALAYYQDKKSVFSITGFCYPLYQADYSYDTVVFNRFSSYGWASWSNRVREVVFDKQELNKLIQTSPGFKKRLDKEGYDLYRMLIKQMNNELSAWDIQMQVHIAENRLKVIYPVISKTANIGFDKESSNTFGINFTKTKQDDGEKREFNFCDVDTIIPSLQKQLRKPFNFQSLAKRKFLNTIIKLTSLVKK